MEIQVNDRINRIASHLLCHLTNMKKSPFKKNVSILYIYDKLLNNRYLDKKEVQAELLINDLTFKRYIKDLREYFSFMRKDEEIYYDRDTNLYWLKKKTLDLHF